MDKICEFRNVKIAHKEVTIFKNLNFSIGKGELVYLIGKTGSGKSSLLRTIYAEIPMETGDGTVCGYDLRKIKSKEIPFLRRKLGIIFQDFKLLIDRSIYDNLLFVLYATGWNRKKTIDSRIDEVLDLVGLKYKKYKMPHELSGGEQQRVVIARALLNSPELILADEPTGNLDPDTSEGIVKLLFDIKNSGRTVIVATHDYTTLKKYNSRTMICDEKNYELIEQQNSVIDFNLMDSEFDLNNLENNIFEYHTEEQII